MTPLRNPTPSAGRGKHLPAWLLDLLLGIAVTIAIALAISSDQGGEVSPDAVAYLFAGAFGALMLLRRRFPLFVLVATMALLFGYYTLGYPSMGLAVPVAAALYSAAERRHVTAVVAVSLILLITSTYFRLQEGQSVAFLLGYELVSSAALMAAAIALGDNTRARRDLRAEQEQTAQLIAQEHAHRAEQRVQTERVRIARDLHDVIGHSISVISLHANVAKEAIGRDDDQARRALAHIQAASAGTMRELRATVKLLRSPVGEEAERSPASLANLAVMVENAAGSGLHVQVQTSGDLGGLPATVDAAAYRIVQEALTNVLRHAGAGSVCIQIENDGQALRLHVADDGKGAHGPVKPGSGIAGMSERARLLGGTLQAEPAAGGGFAVSASLPLRESK